MRPLSVLLLLLAMLAPARAASDLEGLLGDLGGPAGGGRGEVRVEDRLLLDGRRGELVVRLVPTGDAKLIADPGASIEVMEASGVRWPEGRRAVTPPADTDYLPGGVTLRLPFERTGAGAIDVRLEYFWCYVGWQCFLGEKRIRRALPVPAG